MENYHRNMASRWVLTLLDVRSDYQESGLAAGIKVGSELHNFLADPDKFLKSASELWRPIVTAKKSSIEAMNAYLKFMEGKQQ